MSGLFGGTKAKGLPNAVPALNIQQSSYGVPVSIVYGTNRTSGNMIWYSDFNQVLVSTGGSSGKGGVAGGGGKGGGSQSYNYYASFMIGVCEGQISGINQVWASKQTYANLAAVPGVLFNGALGQSPWGYLTTNHPTQADPYNKLAYVAFQNLLLGTSAETPQFSFEVQGLQIIGDGNQDALPSNVITDFIERAGFPSAYIGSFTAFTNYTGSMGFFISPVVDQQRQALDYLKEWMDTLNSEFIWSGGLLSIVPYGDTAISGNGFTFTPSLTPAYALTDDDFIVSGDEDPVESDRADLPDAYNRMPIEYLNRADQYNTESYIAEDQAAIDQYGVRVGSTLRAHHVTDPVIAQNMIYLKLWRSIYIDKGNSYTFKLPWNFILLDPMDLVTLTTGTILTNKLVRIKKIEEDADGVLTFTAEDVPGAIAAPALYSTQGAQRFVGNYNATPSNVNAPVFYETPLALVQANDVELNIAVSGAGGASTNWGGCQVWLSTDGVTYQYVDQINTPARMGTLTANLANYTSGGIDTTNTLSITMTESDGNFNNAASDADATSLNTLCYVDGELICFGQDVLTGSNAYNLTYLNRGAYQSTISAHSSGTNFVRYDAAVYRFPMDQARVGQTLYFKFLSNNIYGGAVQSLADVSAYTYTVLGTALLTALANPTNLTSNYFGDIAQINWTPVTDIRTPIFYEIRVGATWASGALVGRTTQQTFRVASSGTYWVSAMFTTPLGVNVYSSSPPSVVISVSTLTVNVIGSYSEQSSWTGTKTNCTVSSGNLISTLGAASASYVAPSGHEISSAYICNARVNLTVVSAAVSADTDITAITDITAVPDITFAASQGYVMVTPQVNLSQDGGSTWGGWQNWLPGVYTFNKINFQLLITVSNLSYQASISTFNIEVDVDDLIQTGTVNTSAGGTVSVTFPDTFNTTPAVLCTIQNASAGDDVILTSVSASGFTIKVLNSGSNVVRTVTYSATGY